MRIKLLTLLSILASGCQQSQNDQAAGADGGVAGSVAAPIDSYTSPQGVAYRVQRVPGVTREQLPVNSDLKMADFDLAKYAETLCSLAVPPSEAPQSCDVYVQPDNSGTLIGYAALIQDGKDVSFTTATTLNEKKQAGGGSCYLGGKLSGSGEDWDKPIRDLGKDFTGQFGYVAWEKEPGNWLVAPMDDSASQQEGAGGMWYLEKKAQKLRIYQERWNYCYKDSTVSVDDVYYLAVSLVRT